MDHQRANSYPNEAAAFPSAHNGRFSNQFVPSQPVQSSAFVPTYTPGAPGFGSASTSPIMPNVDAHQNNLKLFNRFKLELSEESLPTYVSTAEKLAHWMRKEQAFYPEAKPYIVNFLELAQVTLYRACRITPSPKHPFHISQCPPQAANLAEAYVRLVQAVRKFEYKFVEPDFRSRLADVFSTVDPIPGKPSPSFNRPRPPPVTAHYGPTPPPHSPSVPGGGPQSVFFSTQGITPTPSSPATPFPMFSPGHANALPAGSSHTYAIPSLPSTSPSGARPLSRPGSAAQAHASTAHSPLVGSAAPQASPSVTSASASTPSPSLSNISAGQTNSKPKAKAKKLSVFGALDFLSSDLEWYAKKKGKGVENKVDGDDEKTKEELKVEGEVPAQQGLTGAITVEESKDSGAEIREGMATTIVGEEQKDVVDHEDKPTELEVAEAPLAPAAQLEEPKDEVSEPTLETGATEREEEVAGDAAVQVLDKKEAKDDEGNRADEEPMDVATEDDDASDKIEQMLTGGLEPEGEVRATEAVTAMEDTQPDEGGVVVSPSVPETVVKDVQEGGKQDAPQPMDVDKVEADALHITVQGPEQAMQVEEAPTQKAPSDEPSAPPKRKKKRRGPPGIPANQIVGALPMPPHSAPISSSRESSPETTLASAVVSPTRKAPAHSARAPKRSTASGSSSESDAPLSSRLVARRSVSDTKPKRTAPRVPRRTHSVQGPDKVEKTGNEDVGRSTRTSSPPGGTGNEDVEMQEADDITSPGQPSAAPQTMAESQASSSSRHSSLHAVTAMEEGELTLRDIDRAVTQEDGEVTPTATARPLEDTDPAVSDAPDARRATFFDERMVVLGFARGTPRGQSVTISFELNMEQAAMVKRWTERYNTNDDPADLRCVSLACHRYADCSSMLDELESTLGASTVFARVPAEWPLRSHPRLALGQRGEPESVLPVTRLSIDRDNLLDISVRAHEGHNTVEITSVYGDTTDFVFVIHLHPPTSQQCDELEKRRAENAAWKLLLKNMATFQIPKIGPLLNLDTELARAKV